MNDLSVDADWHANERSKYQHVPTMSDKDYKHDWPCLVKDTYLASYGVEGILKTTNFPTTIIRNIYERPKRLLTRNLSTDNSKDSNVSWLNNLSIILTLTKNGGTWDSLERITERKHRLFLCSLKDSLITSSNGLPNTTYTSRIAATQCNTYEITSSVFRCILVHATLPMLCFIEHFL